MEKVLKKINFNCTNIYKIQSKNFFKLGKKINPLTYNNKFMTVSQDNYGNKTSKRNFWDKINNLFKNYKSKTIHDEIVIKNKGEKYEEEWYEPSEPLFFVNKKLNLVKISSDSHKSVERLQNFLLLPLTIFSGYKLVTNLIHLRPFRTLFWGLIFTVSFRSYRGISVNKNLIIHEINLLEDGTKCEIISNRETKIVDIQSIRQLNAEEIQYYLQMIGGSTNGFVPIIIGENFYLMFKDSYVPNKELLLAVKAGKYIKIKEDNIVDKEDVIDIK